MKVKLAGYNIDKSLIKQIADQDQATPETISAAYARISRDPRDVSELRKEALEQMEKARRSNKAIVFGMSHHSVAEHAYFNFDVLQISRLALEELEARRIGSAYTEKSQRYITLEGDFVCPAEFSIDDVEIFKALIKEQNTFYQRNLQRLIEYQFDTHPELSEQAKKAADKGVSNKMNRAKNTLEGWAKEDARYALSLATQAQLGLSFNARTLEHSIRIMRHSRLAESRELSLKLYDVTRRVTPSLIILSDPEEFRKTFKTELQDNHYKLTGSSLRKYVKQLIKGFSRKIRVVTPDLLIGKKEKLIREIDVDKNIAAAVIHKNSIITIEKAYQLADYIVKDQQRRDNFFAEVMKYISAFDSLPREFEFCGELKYELVVSASNFAQLKRHRLMTLLAQDYDPALGITIPTSIRSIGFDAELKDVCDKSEALYRDFLPKYGKAAEYCLTNAHRRRVLISVNPRELYHLSRLREDEHAQWDIKETAGGMIKLAKQVAPGSFLLASGKDKFQQIKKDIYKK